MGSKLSLFRESYHTDARIQERLGLANRSIGIRTSRKSAFFSLYFPFTNKELAPP
jgi:hypothetical protein